uniref:transcription factor HES-5-like n=1 Tax=Oncorhynchus gorbuscha TaxID=8017 RepID=UPI001EAECEFA|nr:transcription factor HES-5-like [Oncorhynchus gorbuscha]
MAPTYINNSANTILSAKDKHKLRKPVAEKMCRDRINTCIEQLKTLLEREFHKQDPNTKLEKAVILEMTVGFLMQKLQPQSPIPQRAYSEGYSQGWRETLHFLSSSSMKDMMLQNLQRAGQDVCTSSPLSSQLQHHSQGPVKQATSGHKTVWRPW